MWSDDPPDEQFFHALDHAFADVRAHTVTFPGPLAERECASTVYVARAPKRSGAGGDFPLLTSDL
jgi:hypothetical protein